MCLDNSMHHVIWEYVQCDGMMIDIFGAEFEKPELN